MIGAYVAFLVRRTGVRSGWPCPPPSLGGLLVGAALEAGLFRHFYAREHLDQVLLTFALILLFEEFRSLLVGNDFHSVPVPALLDFSVPITPAFSLFGLSLRRDRHLPACWPRCCSCGSSAPRMGAIIRAAAEKPEMVDVLGIDARRVHLTVFAVGTALALIAGALAAPLSSVYPNMGDGLLIISFVVVVIGGLGSVSGAFWSALSSVSSTRWARPTRPRVAGLAVYVLMAAVLLWRPTGLFGRRPHRSDAASEAELVPPEPSAPAAVGVGVQRLLAVLPLGISRAFTSGLVTYGADRRHAGA